MLPRRAAGRARARGRPRRVANPPVVDPVDVQGDGAGVEHQQGQEVPPGGGGGGAQVPQAQGQEVPQGGGGDGAQIPQAAPAPAAALDPAAFMQQVMLIQAQTLQILQTMQQAPGQGAAQPAQPAAAPQVDYVDLATRHRPPTFSGGSDPMALDDWGYQMSRVFQHIGCPEGRKVLVASQYLAGPALHWWRSRETELTQGQGCGWTGFQDALRSHFFTPQLLGAKRSEFLSLVQGNDMSVTAYHQRFVELLRYAPEVVPTEADKVRKFIEGLKAEIRTGYGFTQHATVSAAYDQALFCERARADERRIWQSRKRDREGRQGGRGQRGPVRGRDGGTAGRGGGQVGGRGRGAGGQPRAQGQEGRAAVKCWECQEVGHRRHECPRLAGQQGEQARGAVVPADRGRQVRGRGGRLNVIERADADRRDDVLAGTSVFCFILIGTLNLV